jgi:hypothetical protein
MIRIAHETLCSIKLILYRKKHERPCYGEIIKVETIETFMAPVVVIYSGSIPSGCEPVGSCGRRSSKHEIIAWERMSEFITVVDSKKKENIFSFFPGALGPTWT